ncbi:FxsB family cyclophane-forming radical SAM/SPASM peptide maturase [Actinomadura napierensis]|uniref:FxsB family radical SAM/SPASM domain protein n=1 Tax=Actinomadura napierensis TaxID=267854 RepID=A0ABN2ZS27_9ACTN
MIVPFQQFVLKVHSRCNLACDYCYVYAMADQGWRSQPRRMPDQVVDDTLARIAEHAVAHRLPSVRIILHGGEPLLAGPDLLTALVDHARAVIPAQVLVSLQTNGVLLDDPTLALLRAHEVRIAVSLDGDAVTTNRHRRFADGRSSHASVVSALRRLRHVPEAFAGILCTIDLQADPVGCYEALLEFSPPQLDFLLPHGSWSSPPPFRPADDSTPYADWLLAVFERWYGAPAQETSIRLFTEMMQLLLGGPGGFEGLGLRPSSVIVVGVDGGIRQLDSLSAVAAGVADLGLNVAADSFDAALTHPLTRARQAGLAGLARTCQRCTLVHTCGGGLFTHRYDGRQKGDSFAHPSVYCPDLTKLITAVDARIHRDLNRVRGPG